MGYWQTTDFFQEVGLPIFRSDIILSEKNLLTLKKIQKTNSVVIHVRRGDFIKGVAASLYGGICTVTYYKKAINVIKSKIDNPIFYFFSDDPDYVRDTFDEKNMEIIYWNKGKDSFYDMYLMAQSSNMIVANSTFSCWAAYLNKNAQYIICPSRWRNDHPNINLSLSHWIKI
jgi:hypothetical protein